jgi:glycosyltransferase involved in cell wall biosynthesis
MRIALATDAWRPQINGVVQTWSYVQQELAALGHELRVLTPEGARTIPAPSEPELRLALNAGAQLRRRFDGWMPDAVHIATEGPVGLAARRWALRNRWPFTTSYHTRFPEYLRERFGLPPAWTYRFMRWFHRPAQRILVPTEAMRTELAGRGFGRLRVWTRGVDPQRFAPGPRDAFEPLALPRPIFLSVGRVAPEKGLEGFLELDLPGSKVVIGDGPSTRSLQQRYPQAATWLGMKVHAQLAPYYRAADVFVFPSRTDTFGLVMLEAMACGTPVAAFPVTGPVDVVTEGVTGVLRADLRQACLAALQLDRASVRRHAVARTWRSVADGLVESLAPIPHADGAAAGVLQPGTRT